MEPVEDTPNNQSDPSQASDGEISQSDIDALMNDGDASPEEATPSTPDQSGEVSQANIDALMNGGDAASADAASSAPAESGEVSQADIEAVINGDDAGSVQAAAPAPAPAASDEIAQADIDALMGGGDSPAVDPGAQVMAASDGVSQADIDALFDGGGAADPGGPTESAGTEPAAPEVDTRVDTLGRPFDAAAAEMQAALDAEKAEAAANPSTPAPAPFAPQPLQADAGLTVDPKRVTMLSDVKLRVKIELGRTRMLVEDVLKLGEGSVVELDKLAGDPVDVIVNGRLVARGEVLILNDNFCVRVSEVLSHDPHRITV